MKYLMIAKVFSHPPPILEHLHNKRLDKIVIIGDFPKLAIILFVGLIIVTRQVSIKVSDPSFKIRKIPHSQMKAT
jgi:hypothetical protein